MSNLRALLHHELLLETYQQEAANLNTPLTQTFFTNPENVTYDEANLLYSPISMKPAPLNRRGAAAHVMEQIGKVKRKGAMFHQFNSLPMSQDVFQGLLDPDSKMIVAKASKEVREQAEQFAVRNRLTKELVLSKILTAGIVYMDANGSVMETSNAAYESLDFGIDSSHQTTLGGIIEDDWDSTTADIPTQLDNLRIEAAKENVTPPGIVLCNSTVKEYLRTNADLTAYIQASYNLSEKTVYGEFLTGFLGMDWMFIDGWYTDSSDTKRKYIPDGKAIFLPKDQRWLKCLNGLELVPTTLDVSRSLDECLNSLTEVYGEFAYGAVTHNPVRLEGFWGDNFGFVVREPNAIWQATIAS